MKMQFAKTFLVVSSLALGSLSPTYALPTLMLSADGGLNWTTVVSATPGSLTYSGYVGSWSVGVSGLTISSPAELDLLDVTANTRRAGTLLLRFFETDLSLDTIGGYFKNEADGTVANRGSLTLKTYIDPSNGVFTSMPGTAVQLTSQSFYGAFDGSVDSSYSPLPTEPFSLMVEAKIMLRGAGGRTTFSQSLVDPPPVPDGGASLLLLGAGLATLGIFSATRKRHGSA